MRRRHGRGVLASAEKSDLAEEVARSELADPCRPLLVTVAFPSCGTNSE
jgi:hypothetical protein